MPTKITLNNKTFKFNEKFLPYLVVWVQKSWASYFSISLVANLINQGCKIIFFTAFLMAKQELLTKIWKEKTFNITKKDDLKNIPQNQSIIIQSWNKEELKQVIKNIKNLEDYIIFVKNIEEYDDSILEIIGTNKKIILSWNLDDCSFKDSIINKRWESKIIFTFPEIALNIQIPILEKYDGYLINTKINGILKLI